MLGTQKQKTASLASKRTVCDRCHGQKLRCDRDNDNLDSCKRCRRAGAICTFTPVAFSNQRSHAGNHVNSNESTDTQEACFPPAKRRRHARPKSQSDPNETETEEYQEQRAEDALLTPVCSDSNGPVFMPNSYNNFSLENELNFQQLMGSAPPSALNDSNHETSWQHHRSFDNPLERPPPTSAENNNRTGLGWPSSPQSVTGHPVHPDMLDLQDVQSAYQSSNSPPDHTRDSLSTTTTKDAQSIKANEKKITRLFSLHQSLYQIISEPNAAAEASPSIGEAFNFTKTLIEIIHGTCPQTSTQNPKANSFFIGSVNTSDLHPDPTIIFLIISCYLRLLTLYEQLIACVQERLTATSPHFTRTTSAAIQFVQIVSSVALLAQRLNDAVAMLAEPTTEPMQLTLEFLPGLSGGERSMLCGVVAGPLRRAERQKRRLAEGIRRVAGLIAKLPLL
ncbi:hypothetical protein MMC30_002472 [Trapelia coarctata]|nr:hypothetical protein [Trapelia coarctata]